jgi:hypothetical protein
LGRLDRVRVSGAGETVMLSGPVTVSTGVLVSVAFTCAVEVPATVGVPLTRQLADKVSPTGSVPPAWLQAYGAVPPDTPMVAL